MNDTMALLGEKVSYIGSILTIAWQALYGLYIDSTESSVQV